MVVGIIGAGASGMAAALAAASQENVQVILMERQARVGRKLQATGNGRCNLSNIHADVSHYHGQQPEFVLPALEQLNTEKTLQWFAKLGLFTVTEPTGKVYPYSDQANSVVDVLRFALEQPNITLHTGFEVEKVRRQEDKFLVQSGQESIVCDKVIIACGGLAGSKLGGTMSGYKLLSKFGHKSTKLRPSLVQLRSSWPALSSLKGIRANCYVKIYHDDVLYNQSTGELQFTDYGLSGPVIFEISRDVCAQPGAWTAKLDFLPDFSYDVLAQELVRRKEANHPVEELLTGILHNRLGRVLTKAAGVTASSAGSLSDTEIAAVVSAVKALEVTLTEPMGMDSAQVTAGGVITQDFNPNTMESLLVEGLFACGEVLDIDGDCGGFNLQWAWSSGFLAGLSAGKENK